MNCKGRVTIIRRNKVSKNKKKKEETKKVIKTKDKADKVKKKKGEDGGERIKLSISSVFFLKS